MAVRVGDDGLGRGVASIPWISLEKEGRKEGRRMIPSRRCQPEALALVWTWTPWPLSRRHRKHRKRAAKGTFNAGKIVGSRQPTKVPNRAVPVNPRFS